MDNKPIDTGYTEFLHNISKDKSNLNINFIFTNFYLKSKVNFKISCNRIDKRFKKKAKKEFIFQLKFVKDSKRINIFLKNMYFVINKSSEKKLHKKLTNFLTELMVNFKSSEMYKFKLLTLKQLSDKKE